MRPLTLTDTLEYYDVPQIITAADATGTRYLCTLYEQTADGYHYLGVQISEPRLMAFIGGQLDLRDTYQLEVPARDRITFSTLIARMGWPAFALRKTIGQVAAF